MMSALSRDAIEIGVPLGAFAYGAAVGSFLNVVIYRLPRADEGLSVIHPKRSFCPGCGNQIAWYDNLPLVSYFALAGRCRKCRTRIPLRYFGVELLTACLFAYAAYHHVVEPLSAGLPARWAVLIVHAALIAAMVAVTFIDIDHQIIPDRIDKPGMALAVALSPLIPALHAGHRDLDTIAVVANVVPGRLLGLGVPPGLGIAAPWLASLASCLIGMAVGAGTIYAIGVLGKLAFRKEAMGFGDVKYMGMLGGFLGWKGVLLALLVGSFAGAIIGMAVKLLAKTSYIPFGPFLSLGALGVLFFRHELVWVMFDWYPRMIR